MAKMQKSMFEHILSNLLIVRDSNMIISCGNNGPCCHDIPDCVYHRL